MPSIEVDLSEVAFDTATWSNVGNVFRSDDTYAVVASGVNGTLQVWVPYQYLPTDIELTGVEVDIEGKLANGGSNEAFSVGYFVGSDKTVVSNTKVTSNFTVSDTTYTVGGSADLWGYNLHRTHITRSPAFGITITPSGDLTDDKDIDNIILRVHYTTASYLRGSRSVFTETESTAFDYYPNRQIGDPPDTIERKYNSLSQEQLVKSEDMNLLGDALYNIQKAIQNSQNHLRIQSSDGLICSGFKKPLPHTGEGYVVATVEVTGTAGGSDPVSFVARAENGTFIEQATSGLTSVAYSYWPYVASVNDVVAVKAFGWVDNGSNIPIAVSPYIYRLEQDRESSTNVPTSFALGFTAVGSSFGTLAAYNASTSGYTDSFITVDDVPSGTVHVRLAILGLGENY